MIRQSHLSISRQETALNYYIVRWEHIKQVQVDKDREKFLEFVGGYVSTRAEHRLEKLIKRIQRGEI